MVFWAALLLGLCWLLLIGHDPLAKWLTVRVDARFLPVTRVAYASICLYTAVQHLWVVQYAIEPSNFDYMGWPENKPLAYALYTIYFAALLALLFGKGIRAAWIVLFLVGGVLTPHTLESVLKIPLNFFGMFVSPALWRGDRSAESPWSGWPLLMSGACMAFITTGAGFFKLIDPVWQHGTGFYYALSIPFFSPKHLWPLLDIRPLVVACNWATIIVECIALPLFVIRRTRLLGLLCIVGLGVFLSWPMWGIGLVGGPVLLSFVPAWAAICPSFVRWWSARRPSDIMRGVPDRAPDDRRPSWWIVMIAWYVIIGCIGDVLGKYHTFFGGTPVYGAFAYTGDREPLLPHHIERRISSTAGAIYRTRPDRMHEVCWLVELFDYHHLFERVTYRVRVEDDQGEWHTVEFFDQDGAMLPERAITNYSHTLEPVSAVISLRHRDRSGPLAVYAVRTLNDVIRYAMSRCDRTGSARRAVLDVRPLHMPHQYAGALRPWVMAGSYVPFYAYDAAMGTGRVVGEVPAYAFDSLDVPAFRDRLIIPLPDAPLSFPTPDPGI